MSNNGIVKIHGKDYMTVARRVELAHEEGLLEVVTEVLNNDPVVIKATVKTKKGIFTGISSVNLESAKMIEKSNPYEVAETSAVGRALGFAGYGIVESIASADEMVKAAVGTDREFEHQGDDFDYSREEVEQSVGVVKAASAINWKKCAKHGKAFNADLYSQCYICATGGKLDDSSMRGN